MNVWGKRAIRLSAVSLQLSARGERRAWALAPPCAARISSTGLAGLKAPHRAKSARRGPRKPAPYEGSEAEAESLLLHLNNRCAITALLAGSRVELGDQRMVLQVRGDAATQLPGAVAVRDPHLHLVGHQRLVEKSRDPIERLIDGRANDVQLAERAFACGQIDVDAHLGRGRRLRLLAAADEDLQPFERRAQLLAAHVDFDLVALNRRDHAFQPETADRDPCANRRRNLR